MKITFRIGWMHPRQLPTFVLLLLAAFAAHIANAEKVVNKDWATLNGTPDTIKYSSSTLDPAGNLIVAGNTLIAAGNTDILVTKYKPDGSIIWQQHFDGTSHGNDYGVAVTTDASSNIYVAGVVSNTNTGMDIGILKLNSSGTLLWSANYNGTASLQDIPTGVVVDPSGYVYACGGVMNNTTSTDYVTIKYSPSGVPIWSVAYDYNGNNDFATGLSLDGGNVVVTGGSESALGAWDYATIRYNTINGNLNNSNRVNIPGGGLDKPAAIARDNQGNIYITGYVDQNGNRNIQTVKINSSFTVDWVRSFDVATEEDAGTGIGVDTNGNSYVCGYSYKGGHSMYVTIKYDPSGNEVWSQFYIAKDPNEDATASNIFVAGDGTSYITGSTGTAGNLNYQTICYDPNGRIMFEKAYDDANYSDIPTSIQMDNYGHLYVTGNSYSAYSSTYSVLRYSIFNKTAAFEVDANDNPDYAKNELITGFRPEKLKKNFINNKELGWGRLSDILSDTDIAEMQAKLDYDRMSDITVVKIFRDMVEADTISISRLGDTVIMHKHWAAFRLIFPTDIDELSYADTLNTMPNLINYAHTNFAVTMDNVPNDAYMTTYDRQASLIPNLTYPNASINASPAWDIETGKPYVKVGICDFSVQWRHEDFGTGIWGQSKVVGGKNYYSGVDEQNVTNVQHSHGTGCAGIIGALRNNSIGVAGIAGGDGTLSSGVSLYSLGCDPELGVTISVLASALVDGANSNVYGVHAINCSWGKKQFTNSGQNQKSLLDDAVNDVWLNDCLLVASSGNDGNNGNPTQWPAAYPDPQVLCVGGTGTNGEYLNGTPSNPSPNGDNFMPSFGQNVDVAAPATSQLMTTTQDANHPLPISANCSGVNSTQYICFNGTSGAAPHVTGVAALMMSRHNTQQGYANNLGSEDVEHLIERFATDVNTIGFDQQTGWGRVDAGNAVQHIDNPTYKVAHYTFTNNTQTTLLANNIQVTLPVSASNFSLAAGVYFADKYRVVRTTYHDISSFPNGEILDAWERHNGCNGTNGNNVLDDQHTMDFSYYIYNNNQTIQVNCTTFVYKINTAINGQSINTWYPCGLNNTKMGYSVYYKNVYSPTGVEQHSGTGEDVILYPNPAHDIVNVNVSMRKPEKVNIEVLDMTGKQLYYSSEQGNGTYIRTLPVSNLPAGMYFVKLLVGDNSYERKFVKK